jgi:hypothetical protein
MIRVDRSKLLAVIVSAAGISLVIACYRGLFDSVDWQNIEFGPWTTLGVLATLVLMVLVLEGMVKLYSWISWRGRR